MVNIEGKHLMMQVTRQEVEQILAQYNRTVDNVQVDIDGIKKWIQSQPHLAQIPMHQRMDRLFLQLLIYNKFSIEKSKTKIDYYYSIRSIVPELYENRFPTNPDIIELRKIHRTFTLPKLVNLNRIVFFVLDEMDHKFSAYTFLAKCFMDIDALCSDLHSSFDAVFDFCSSNFEFWTAITPTIAKLFIIIVEKVYSTRAHAIRLIGMPSFARIIINTGLACLPKKIQSRVTVHRDRLEMAKYYPKEQLPVEFGGTGRPYREMSKDFDDIVDSCTDYFKTVQNFKVDEKLRPKKLDNDEFLGFHGNFRKLEVD